MTEQQAKYIATLYYWRAKKKKIFFKRLFCPHCWFKVYESFFYNVWTCTNCGKEYREYFLCNSQIPISGLTVEEVKDE